MRQVTVLAALVTVLAGCGQANAPVRADKSRPVAAAPKAAANPVVSAPKPQGKAVVDAQGVVFDFPGGKTEPFEFGTARSAIEPLAARVFGQPRIGRTEECGAGPVDFAQYGPLTLNFQQGDLVGWIAGEGDRVVTTDSVAPGKLMRDLRIARSARMIEDSTLDGEFEYVAADGQMIRGFVTGSGRDAKIASLYAGVNCFFR